MDIRAQRQALTVALLSVAAVVTGTIVLAEITDLSTDQVLFESVSAFATVGLTTGITPGLPAPGQLILVALMFLGRLGPVTGVCVGAAGKSTSLPITGRQAHRWLNTAAATAVALW